MHVYIGFPAGSGADILGRYFTTQLEKLAGKPVIVENKPGANSNIAAGIVAKAKPDGYSILFVANSNMAGSRFLFKNLPFDTVKDFVPAATLRAASLSSSRSAPSRRSRPSPTSPPISRAASRTSTAPPTRPRSWRRNTTSRSPASTAVNVAYRTAPEALPDVEDGTLDFMVMDGTFAMGPIKAGKIRALAVTTEERIAGLPDVPTMKEAGLDFVWSPWWGVYLPAKTPTPIVEKIGGWMRQITKTEETRAFLERIAVAADARRHQGGPRAAPRRHREVGAAGEGRQDRAAVSRRLEGAIRRAVMAGLVPAIHVFESPRKANRGCPAQGRA